MWRIGPVLLACLALLSCGAPPASGQERFHDFGRPDDGDPSGQIYLTPEWSFWGGHDWKTFIRYENEKGFWWATTPPDPESCIT